MDEEPKVKSGKKGTLNIVFRALNERLQPIQPYIFGRDAEGRHAFARLSGVGVGWIGLVAALLTLSSAAWVLHTWIVAAFAGAHIGLLIIGQFSLTPARRLVVALMWLVAVSSGFIVGYSTFGKHIGPASVAVLNKDDFRLKILRFKEYQGAPEWIVGVQWSSRVDELWNELTDLYFSGNGQDFELSPYGISDAIPVKGERFHSAKSLYIKFKTWEGMEVGPFNYSLNFGEFATKSSESLSGDLGGDGAKILELTEIDVTYQKGQTVGSNSTWRLRVRFPRDVSSILNGAHPEYRLDDGPFGTAVPLGGGSIYSHTIPVTNAAGAKTLTLRYKTGNDAVIGPRKFDIDFSEIALTHLKANILTGTSWVWCQRSYDRSAAGGPPECFPHDLANNAPAIKEVLIGSSPQSLTKESEIRPDEDSLNWAGWQGAKERGMTRISVPEAWEKLFIRVRFFDNSLSELRSYKMP